MADAAPAPADDTTPAAPVERTRRRGLLWTAVGLLAVVGGAVAWGAHKAGGLYEYTPGDAPEVTTSAQCSLRGSSATLTLPGGRPCARIDVPAGSSASFSGRLLMVDVLVGKPSPQDVLLDEVHLLDDVHPGAQLLPAAEVLGRTPASQLACQDAQEMTDATQSAAVAALSRIGDPVTSSRLGARVVEVVPSSAAAAAGVRCNDLITAVNGTKVASAADIADVVHAAKPGQDVTVTVQRAAKAGAAASPLTLKATLGSVPAQPASGGAPATPAQPDVPFLGVATRDDVRYDLPIPVKSQVGDIGGPSAGLALTLGIIDALSGGHLTGGHVVAATGTIDPSGVVGDVGGVAQKTVAVQRAGAQLFLVPPQELAVASSHARPGMRVVAVRSLAEALAELARLGGTVPPVTAATTA